MERLDKLLVARGLAASRTQAQRLIETGSVRANYSGLWQLLDKPSLKLDENIELAVEAIAEHRYVSRAGLKLESALARLCSTGALEGSISTCARGVMALDIGQSTGGFTDCLLKCGAKLVVGVDVGHGQLSSSLIGHPQVVTLEGINARHLPIETLRQYAPEGFDWVVMDVSFISQTLILPWVPAVLKSGGLLLSLVKPQFEVGPEGIGKGGLVKNDALLESTQERILQSLAAQALHVVDYFESGIPGGDGNREFFAIAQKL